MTDARPLAIGWGHSRARDSAGWRLRVRWPLEWLKTHGLCDFIEIDERVPSSTGAAPPTRRRRLYVARRRAR